MPFTDRYIPLPVEMCNKKEAELTGNDDAGIFEAYGKFNPLDICGYHPCFDDDGVEQSKTAVHFKYGDSIIVLLPIYTFEDVLNEFMK